MSIEQHVITCNNDSARGLWRISQAGCSGDGEKLIIYFKLSKIEFHRVGPGDRKRSGSDICFNSGSEKKIRIELPKVPWLSCRSEH